MSSRLRLSSAGIARTCQLFFLGHEFWVGIGLRISWVTHILPFESSPQLPQFENSQPLCGSSVPVMASYPFPALSKEAASKDSSLAASTASSVVAPAPPPQKVWVPITDLCHLPLPPPSCSPRPSPFHPYSYPCRPQPCFPSCRLPPLVYTDAQTTSLQNTDLAPGHPRLCIVPITNVALLSATSALRALLRTDTACRSTGLGSCSHLLLYNYRLGPIPGCLIHTSCCGYHIGP